LLPAGNILVKDADITVDVFSTTFVHSFKGKNRFARVFVNINPGSLTAKAYAATIKFNEELSTIRIYEK